MPITPYHFGPSGFIALALRRWLDLPIFVLANVLIDVEVVVILVFQLGYPPHRYAHTLLGGALLGILWGVFAWRWRALLARGMQLLHLSYATSIPKAIVSGILGVWLHVVIDALYHPDVKLAWPVSTLALWRITGHYLPKYRVQHLCMLLFPATVVLYMILMAIQQRRRAS